MTRIRKVCASCGSTAVLADAYVEWDENKQEWVIQNVFDKGSYCEDCDGECSIVDQKLPEKPEST